MSEFAHTGTGTSILSSAQMEWYKVEVDDKSIKVGGKQWLTMLDGLCDPPGYMSSEAWHTLTCTLSQTRSGTNYHTSYSLMRKYGIHKF